MSAFPLLAGLSCANRRMLDGLNGHPLVPPTMRAAEERLAKRFVRNIDKIIPRLGEREVYLQCIRSHCTPQSLCTNLPRRNSFIEEEMTICLSPLCGSPSDHTPDHSRSPSHSLRYFATHPQRQRGSFVSLLHDRLSLSLSVSVSVSVSLSPSRPRIRRRRAGSAFTGPYFARSPFYPTPLLDRETAPRIAKRRPRCRETWSPPQRGNSHRCDGWEREGPLTTPRPLHH